MALHPTQVHLWSAETAREINEGKRLLHTEPAAEPDAGTAQPAASARSVMLRAIPPNTVAWKGATAHQYACPARPCGWNRARWR